MPALACWAIGIDSNFLSYNAWMKLKNKDDDDDNDNDNDDDE